MSTSDIKNERKSGYRGGPLFVMPVLIVSLVALAAVVPFTWLGNASGHDFEFHMYSWLEVVSQWKHGILYPRWAALAHWGYGEARFLFYPPASWHLGALLGSILPWKMAPGAYIWIALTLAGISMFSLARSYLDRGDAVFASALYAANPYLIVIVYWRSAFAELLAASLMPLLLLFVLRLDQDGRRGIIPLSLVIAATWLTNAPSAVMMMYSLGMLLLVLAIVHKKWEPLVYGGAAAVLGLGMAAFYVLPASYETRWVNIAEVLAPGVRPQDNFFFTKTDDPDHNRFNLLVSLIGCAEIVVVAAAAWMASCARAQNNLLRKALYAWAGLAACLMFSPTLFLWDHLPKLRFMQLPWRWLLCLGVSLSLLVTIAIRRWTPRVLVCAFLLGMVLVGWHRIQAPWWDDAPDIKEMVDAMQDGIGYEGADEYVPVGADPYEVKQNAVKVADASRSATIRISQWAPERRTFTVTTPATSKLIVRLFGYPAWNVHVNGEGARALILPKTGQMIVPVPTGESHVQITFVRTWDRALGILISFISCTGLVALLIWERRVRKRVQA